MTSLEIPTGRTSRHRPSEHRILEPQACAKELRFQARSFASLQLLLAVGLLVLVWRLVEGEQVLEMLGSADPSWLIASLAVISIQTVLSALRWRLTAGQLGLSFSRGTALREYYLAQIANQALPGGILGRRRQSVAIARSRWAFYLRSSRGAGAPRRPGRSFSSDADCTFRDSAGPGSCGLAQLVAAGSWPSSDCPFGHLGWCLFGLPETVWGKPVGFSRAWRLPLGWHFPPRGCCGDRSCSAWEQRFATLRVLLSQPGPSGSSFRFWSLWQWCQ